MEGEEKEEREVGVWDVKMSSASPAGLLNSRQSLRSFRRGRRRRRTGRRRRKQCNDTAEQRHLDSGSHSAPPSGRLWFQCCRKAEEAEGEEEEVRRKLQGGRNRGV